MDNLLLWRFVDEEGVGAVDGSKSISDDELAESVKPGFRSDAQTVQRFVELPDRSRSV